MDCIDESVNTTTYLKLFENHGLLRWHRTIERIQRRGIVDAHWAGQIEELEHKIEVLSEEVRKLKASTAIPETAELKSHYGLGPAASKVYSVERGLSIGGYGEFNFTDYDDSTKDDVTDFYRFVLYFYFLAVERSIYIFFFTEVSIVIV